MFYKITDKIEEIELNKLSKEFLTIGILNLAQLQNLYEKFGFSNFTVAECENRKIHMQNTLLVYEHYSFGILNILDTKNISGQRDTLGIYIAENLFLIIDIFDEDQSTRKALETVFKTLNFNQLTVGKFIYQFLRLIISHDNTTYEELEIKINNLDKAVLNGTARNFRTEIASFNRELLVLHNYYEQLINLGENFIENGNNLFSNDEIRYFKLFTNRVIRLSDNTQLLREFVVQVRESYQAQQDYNLNNIMKIFTIVTTIFLPLTLIAGWYGMNFTYMPELHSKIGYPSVIIISILVVIICIIWFKKKKLF